VDLPVRKLLLYQRDGGSFSIPEATRALKALPGLVEVRELPSDEAIVEVDFEDESGSSTVRLNSSGDSILLTWGSDTALNAALLIQTNYRFPIRAIDLDYTFDLDLSQMSDLNAVKNAMSA
jgi:hypothetical protein